MKELTEKHFEELFYKYFDRVYAGLIAKKCSPDIAEELTQITFIKIWEYRSTFSFDIKEEVQIFRKARHVFIDWLRKEAHQRKLMQEIHSAAIDHHRQNLELTDTLKKAIQKLPPMQNRVFRLSYIEGYSHKEIAGKLHISVRTVERHIYKSLSLLRKNLAYISVAAFVITHKI